MAFVDSKNTSPSERASRRSRRARRREISQTYWAREQTIDRVGDDANVGIKTRMNLLRRYGDFSMAYSTAVQPLLQYFGDESGYVAYRQRFGITIALGDPVVSREQRADLVQRFIRQFKRPVFCQISSATAQTLADANYLVNEMGVDTSLDLNDYSFAGKEKEWLRYALNWVLRRGYQIVEADFDSIDIGRIESISEAWRKTRTVKRKEVRFLNRPIVLEHEPGVRRFFLIDEAGEIQAFVFLDPLYRDEKIVGYVTSIKRRHPNAPQYAEHAIMKSAIEELQSEGVPQIRLGLSPGAGLEDNTFKHSWMIAKMFRSIYGSQLINRHAYNLVGHAQYKQRFRGVEEKTYFATTSRFSPRQFAALLGLCGLA